MKQFKIKIIDIFQSLDYEKILGHDLWIIKNQDQKFSKKNYNEILENLKKFFFLVKFFLGTIKKTISSSPIIDVPKDKDLNIFYIRTHSRLDLKKHSEYYEKIIGTTLCVFDKRMKKIGFTVFFNCIYLFYKTNKLWSKAFKNNGVKIFSLNGLNVVLKLFNALSDSLKILPVLFNYRKLVSFTEMLITENILCQIANKNNIETFALEHAVGLYKKEGYDWERYPVVCYLTTVCNNILCWGDYSKKIYQVYTNKKIFIVGKPSLPNLNDVLEGITFVFQSNKCKSANNALFYLSNICQNNKIPISRWFKEQGNLHNKNCKRRDGPLRKIVIGCSGSLLLELGFLGLKVYVINDAALKIFLPKELIIDNPSLIFEKFNSTENYPHEIWKSFIECTGQDSVARYKNIVLNSNKG